MSENVNEEIVKYRIAKANETLGEIELLIQSGFYATAVNRLYYACFYAVVALLTKNNINTKTHIAVHVSILGYTLSRQA